MIDYAASKAAAQSFHKQLTPELSARYNASRVRMVVVNQGYASNMVKTGLRGLDH
jgi:NAD(P)-dependent dehydrogenase (short-subunit alcohol dehydrogenase family)